MTDEQREAIQPAIVTVGRARRFYQILCDLDFDEAIDEAERRRAEDVSGRPVGIAEQAAHDAGEEVSSFSQGTGPESGDGEDTETGEANDKETRRVAIKTNEFMEMLMTKGKLAEMAEVILELPEGVDPNEVPLEEIVEAFPDFIMAYAELISVVGGTSAAIPSA